MIRIIWLFNWNESVTHFFWVDFPNFVSYLSYPIKEDAVVSTLLAKNLLSAEEMTDVSLKELPDVVKILNSKNINTTYNHFKNIQQTEESTWATPVCLRRQHKNSANLITIIKSYPLSVPHHWLKFT